MPIDLVVSIVRDIIVSNISSDLLLNSGSLLKPSYLSDLFSPPNSLKPSNRLLYAFNLVGV
eukprot:SAG31_NODE_1093_length_9952_cov_16.099056_5_plen_61_part_00